MMTQALAAATSACVVRKHFNVKPGSAMLLGLLGVTLVSALTGSRAFHIGAGLLLAGGIGYHAYKRRKAL